MFLRRGGRRDEVTQGGTSPLAARDRTAREHDAAADTRDADTRGRAAEARERHTAEPGGD
jgi:hypothetical protein